jgi:prophage antirepressor-like protein
MNDLVNFTYEGRKVRTIIEDGEPWWVAKDVAEVLKYPPETLEQIPNLISNVPDEWKGRYSIKVSCDLNRIKVTSRARKTQEMKLPFCDG